MVSPAYSPSSATRQSPGHGRGQGAGERAGRRPGRSACRAEVALPWRTAAREELAARAEAPGRGPRHRRRRIEDRCAHHRRCRPWPADPWWLARGLARSRTQPNASRRRRGSGLDAVGETTCPVFGRGCGIRQKKEERASRAADLTPTLSRRRERANTRRRVEGSGRGGRLNPLLLHPRAGRGVRHSRRRAEGSGRGGRAFESPAAPPSWARGTLGGGRRARDVAGGVGVFTGVRWELTAVQVLPGGGSSSRARAGERLGPT